jgi:Uma2 family endonuclease
MPDEKHQAIVFFLIQALKTLATRAGGKATMAPFPVRLQADRFREPDVVFMKSENLKRCTQEFWNGADLAIEVLSDSTRSVDLHTKPGEYARAGIPEYWIVDPRQETVSVLVLSGEAYKTHGVFRRGQTAASTVLEGFDVSVTDVFDAE